MKKVTLVLALVGFFASCTSGTTGEVSATDSTKKDSVKTVPLTTPKVDSLKPSTADSATTKK